MLKTHKSEPIIGLQAYCGRWNFEIRTTVLWELVTCKTCLKYKKKPARHGPIFNQETVSG